MKAILLTLVLAGTAWGTGFSVDGNGLDFPGTIYYDGPNGLKAKLVAVNLPMYQTGLNPRYYPNIDFHIDFMDGTYTTYSGSYMLPLTMSPMVVRDIRGTKATFNGFAISPADYSRLVLTTTAGEGLYAMSPERAMEIIRGISSINVEIVQQSEWPIPASVAGLYTNGRVVFDTPEFGDMNRDGSVDAADAALLFSNWTGDSIPSVPEPSSISLLVLAGGIARRYFGQLHQ